MKFGQYANRYENIPNANFDLKDGVGGLEQQNPEGEKLVLLGTAEDGPKLEPVNVTSKDQVEEIFGTYYNNDGTKKDANLAYGAKRALEQGADNIALMRISGQTATGNIKVNGDFEKVTRKEREYFGEALGNNETTINILEDFEDVSNTKGYKIDSVTVYADGNILDARFYSVDNSNGIIKIKKNAVNSEASLRIKYELVEIVIDRVGYSPTKNSSDEYKLETFDQSEADEKNQLELSEGFAKNINSIKKVNSLSGETIEDYNIVPFGAKDNYSINDNDAFVSSFSNTKTVVEFGDSLSVSSEEEIEIEYLYSEEQEQLEMTSEASKRQFEAEENDIVPGSEIIFEVVYDEDSGEYDKLDVLEKTDNFDGTTSENQGKYKIDYETGLITTYESVDTALYASYLYDNSTKQPKESSTIAAPQTMTLSLDHNASNKEQDEFEYPVTLLADGTEVTKDAFDVDFDSMYQTTVITVKSGFIEQGAELEAVYYWQEEKQMNPEIKLEAANPGSLYNDVSLEIEDLFYEEQSEIEYNEIEEQWVETDSKTAETLVNVSENTFRTSNVEASVTNNVRFKDVSAVEADFAGDSTYTTLTSDQYEVNKEETTIEILLDQVDGEDSIEGSVQADYTFEAYEQVVVNSIDPKFVEEIDSDSYSYKIDVVDIDAKGDLFTVELEDLSSNMDDISLYTTTSETSGSMPYRLANLEEVKPQNIVYYSGKFVVDVPKSEELIIPKCQFRTTEEKISFVTDDTLERIDNETFKLANEDILKNVDGIGHKPITIYLNKSDDSMSKLTIEEDYTVDWASGTVNLTGKKTVSSTDELIAKRYAYYNISGKRVKINKPKVKTGNNESNIISIDLDANVSTVGELVSAINNHDRNNVIECKIDNETYNNSINDILTPEVKFQGNVYNYENVNLKEVLSGGSDETDLTNEQIYEKLGGKTDSSGQKVEYGAYDILIGYEDADIVLPLGVHINSDIASSYKNFANQMAQFLAHCFYESNEIKGFIGVEPISSPTRRNVIDRVHELDRLQTLFFLQDDDKKVVMDQNEQPVDVGKFINVIGHDIYHADENIGVPMVKNGVIEYAALCSMLNEDQAPTNERIKKPLAYKYSKKQANILSGNRLVTFKEENGQIKVTDSPTCSVPNSGWNRYLTIKTVFDTMDKVRAVFNKYIGDGNTIEKRNSLESDVKKELENSGMLKNYDFSLKMNKQDEFMGRIYIQLDLVPVTELREINTVVSINAQL